MGQTDGPSPEQPEAGLRHDQAIEGTASAAEAPTQLAVKTPPDSQGPVPKRTGSSLPSWEGGASASSPGTLGYASDSFRDEEETRFGLVGTVLAERYAISRRLGEGGMGIVYAARHVNLDKDVAVKILLPELSNIPGVSERFEREARSLSRLDHPGIVRVMDFGQTSDGLCYLVMDYVEGRPLSDILKEEAPLSETRAVNLARQILLALAHAHDIGIIHRDLKPDNIMVVSPGTPQESIRILDFGIAKMLEQDQPHKEETQPLTRAGMVFGTPEYLAPEQAAGEPDLVDARSDLYTVGIILFEMLTGRRPFEAPTRMALLNQHITKEPPRLSEALPSRKFPPALEEIVAKALAKDREDRFQSALEFYEALTSLPAAKPILSLWPGAVPPAATRLPPAGTKRRHRSRRLLVFGSLVLLALAGVAGLVVLRMDRHGRRETPASHRQPRDPRAELEAVVAKAPPELRPKLDEAVVHLLKAEPVPALRLLKKVVNKHPDVAAVQFLRGRAFAAYSKWVSALRAYRRAVALDPDLKNSSLLADDLVSAGLSHNGVVHKELVAFLDEVMGPAAKDVIRRLFAQYDRYVLLRELVTVASKHHVEDAIDLKRLYELMLKQSPRCHERGEAARQLARILGPKALKLLKEAHERKPWKYGRKTLDNECIRPLLEELMSDLSKQ